MISIFNNKEDCCGCTACKSICPSKAIVMKLDKEGFLYPQINQELCINCSLCKKVCPLKNDFKVQDIFDKPIVYAFKHNSDKVRMTSASGGAYTAISDYALNEFYVIYGSEFNENFSVKHNRTKTSAGRDKFKGSKYVQSGMDLILIQIREDLKKDNSVLFTGTGCQVAGLKLYLEESKVKMDKLILNDIICHGTPSPLLWEDYLSFIQKRNKLVSYTFRAKEKGWHGYNVKAKFESGKIKINTSDINIYTNLFCSDLALRPSCYNCKFCNYKRPSDILIGDFWGIENSLPEIDDDKGISLVLVNTLKGKKIFEKIKDSAEFVKSNVTDCLQMNLQHPTKMPEKREQFWDDYYKFGFKYISKKYAGYSFKSRSKKFVANILTQLGLLDVVKKLIQKRAHI